MAYAQFKITDLRRSFGLQDSRQPLFAGVEPLAPSAWLLQTLSVQADLPLVTEKAKSEWIIAPILTDVWLQNGKSFTIHSGINLEADAEKGLNGECDFILAAGAEKSYFLHSPIFTMVEAKRDDFFGGIPQCAAQMIGARRFNEQDGNPIPAMYGCVTNGQEWLFMVLRGEELVIDTNLYFVTNLPEILGVLNWIIKENGQYIEPQSL